MNDTKKFLVSVAVFISSMVTSDAIGQSPIRDIDVGIRDARRNIENLRKARDAAVEADLRKNPDYRFVTETQEDVQARRVENERYLDRAYEYLRRDCRVVLVTRTPFLFIEYSSKYGYIATLGNMYESNRRAIINYEQRRRRLHDFQLKIKNHHDSIMHEKIDSCQLVIDSLLNKKIALVR